MTFYHCNNLRVKNLRFKDAQQMHVTFQECFDVDVSNLVIKAPGDSPNTDGIHVAETQNIVIRNSVIGTGKIQEYQRKNSQLGLDLDF